MHHIGCCREDGDEMGRVEVMMVVMKWVAASSSDGCGDDVSVELTG
ncbi:hypothetical protein Tco_1454158, partial [Tanacetum coccineum]